MAGPITRVFSEGASRTPAQSDTRTLLEAAATLGPLRPDAAGPQLETFASLYLDWILSQRGMSRQTTDRREKTSFMLHGLVAARSLGEAVGLYQRFAKLLWGDKWLVEVRETAGTAALTFNPALKADITGLIDDLWTLARGLSELEWLVGGTIDGASGRVRRPMLFDAQTAALFFRRPVVFGSNALVLCLPRRQLDRRVTARAEDIEQFCAALPLSTLASAPRERELKTLVAEIIRRDRAHAGDRRLGLRAVAAQLRLSPATLGRHLRAEGASFRQISEAVLDELARDWLSNSALSIETLAERLGYSDAFAFRRWFGRRNGCSPSTFRRLAGEGGAPPPLSYHVESSRGKPPHPALSSQAYGIHTARRTCA